MCIWTLDKDNTQGLCGTDRDLKINRFITVQNVKTLLPRPK